MYASSSPTSPSAWHVVETANFTIRGTADRDALRRTSDACESLRALLVRQWFDGASSIRWQPKCAVVVHASRADYLRHVGPGGAGTVASARIERRAGKIVGRRIDVRPTPECLASSALAHELAHVVLADHFAGERLPRWIDEGFAVLADSPAKQSRHRRDLHAALAAGAEYRLAELVTLSEYPSGQHRATFYGQSASLVRFLVEHGGERRFLDFVASSLEQGHDQGLRQAYGFGLAELERRWRAAEHDRATELADGAERKAEMPPQLVTVAGPEGG